ncbi:MAG: hypothetical protein E7419_08205 [Ruminococcaceae bacterium]|nr:hypothetical protein [Oscillospiraceae bacterium]
MQDCTDTSNWKVSLRKLLRGKLISKQSLIRISFAYLYRIQIDGKYLLVKNARGTQKFQPVGGAYKYNETEKDHISKNFCVVDDNKIPIDKCSKQDYRMYVYAKNLKKFVRRFNKTQDRETVKNLSREFQEEMIKTGIVDFDHIEYRYCGRHFTDVQYSRFFDCYELLLADIIELIPNNEQEIKLRELMDADTDKYIFATDKQISTCGVEENSTNMLEKISDHTIKILQKTEDQLMVKKKEKRKYKIIF